MCLYRGKIALSIFLFMVLMIVGTICVSAEEFVPYASEIYNSYGVSLSSSKSAAFNVSTSQNVEIKVISVELQKCSIQVGANGVQTEKYSKVKSLTAPDKTVNGKNYTATKDYSLSIPDGGKYRIRAVFSAGGEQKTAYSKGIEF